MILEHAHDLQAFRQAVRAWLREAVPADWPERVKLGGPQAYFDLQRWWMAERNKVGMATPHWPREYGGADLSLAHQIVIADECARQNAPPSTLFTISLNHIPTTLFAYGSEEQKRKYLPGVARGVVWCQGFSEPNAGSDLASLRTSAIYDGDDYVINGQKTWSSLSMHAEYCILLARTDMDARKQQGISYFLLDMKAPGVEVRPIKKSTGLAEFGELFLTDVRIPAENRVGEENQGWTVAQTTLAAERGVLVFEAAERHRFAVERDLRKAVDENAGWLQDAQLRREFMTMFGEMQAGRRQIRGLLAEAEDSHRPPSLTPAIVKLTYSTFRQRYAELRTRIAEFQGQMLADDQGHSGDGMIDYLDSFGHTIGGGTNEVMRNLIAERGLDMPR